MERTECYADMPVYSESCYLQNMIQSNFCRDHHVQKNVMVGAFCLTHRRGVVLLQNIYKFPCTASSYFSCAHFDSDLGQICVRFGSVLDDANDGGGNLSLIHISEPTRPY